MAHHAQPAHFLHPVVGVGDDPVARDELRRHRARVLDGDGVGEDVVVPVGLRLLGQILRLYGYGQIIGGHRCPLSCFHDALPLRASSPFMIHPAAEHGCAHGKIRRQRKIASPIMTASTTPAMTAFQIAPSILSADSARLGEEVRNVLAAGADIIHFDVMDNHYVPNLTIGPLVCQAIRPHVKAPIDVHLMVKPVDRLIPDFAKAGADIITFHPEASDHIDRTLQLIRDSGCKAGLVFNPGTPMHYLNHVMDKIDMILIMSVNPGFGGQSFIPEALKKLSIARRMINESGRDILLEVDGGIKVDNIRAAAEAGADTFVAGSAIFGQPDYKAVIDAMRAELAKVER